MPSGEVSRRCLKLPPSVERTRLSHSEIRKLVAEIRENGFPSPVIIDDQGHVIAGWDLVQAAIHLGCEVPVRRIDEAVGQGGPPLPMFR